jgi:hypothetical protein
MSDSVIVIDGPSRGQVVTARGQTHRFTAVAGVPSDTASADLYAGIETVVYYVHIYAMMGRLLRVASVRPVLEEIREADLFETLASDKAKDAAR